MDPYDATPQNFIKATITTEKYRGHGAPYGAHHVIASAAASGYGPLIYDIAMVHHGKLYADRGSVSKTAKKVWSYYHNNRPDVKKLPIDNIYEPKTVVPENFIITSAKLSCLAFLVVTAFSPKRESSSS